MSLSGWGSGKTCIAGDFNQGRQARGKTNQEFIDGERTWSMEAMRAKAESQSRGEQVVVTAEDPPPLELGVGRAGITHTCYIARQGQDRAQCALPTSPVWLPGTSSSVPLFLPSISSSVPLFLTSLERWILL